MPAPNENKSEDTPAAGSTSVSVSGMLDGTDSPLPKRINSPNVILFLDNDQDARSTRSAIQRHTAHHAAAQRREARLQSSRELTPRNLEWQRRPPVDTSPSSESVATLPLIRKISTTSGDTRSQQQRHPDIEPEQTGLVSQPGRASLSTTQNRITEITEDQERAISSSVVRSIGDDEVCNNFLQAFTLALDASSLPAQEPQHWQAKERCLDRLNRGLVNLRERLGNKCENCADQTIQAVLILFVFATRFQAEQEASSHKAALERMIDLRGGLASFSHNEVLEKQLQCYASGEVEQILQVESGP